MGLFHPLLPTSSPPLQKYGALSSPAPHLFTTTAELAACKTRVIEVRPQQGQQQTLWERQFILAARPQPHLVLSDEQIHCWFDPQGPESTSGCSPAAAGFKETVTVPLTAETNYKFEVAGLLVQWEGAVDSGGYLQGQMGAVCRHWAQANPRGHVIVLCDGTAVARGTLRDGKARDNIRQGNSRRSKEAKQQKRREKIQQAKQKERRLQEKAEGGPAYVPGLWHTSAAQQKSQIISCLKALATEAPCPVYGLQVTSTLDAGEFSLPPSPGLLAFLHRRHCLNLHHRSTVYVYSDMKHMKMAEKAGVRHIQLKTCHSATASPIPPMLQQLQLVAECRTATDSCSPLPAIPLAGSLGTFTDHYVCVDRPRGLREFLFAQDTLQVERFQRQYADGAAPVGGEVGSGRGVARPEAERLEERDDDYLADTLVSDDQATLREVHESNSAAPRHIPAWMLRKKSSSVESDPTPATLEKSASTSSVEGRARSRHTIYIMTEKELLETAKDVLKQAGREDVIETCTLRSGEGGTAQSAKRDRGGGKVAPASTASVTEDTDIIGPTPTAATQHSGQQDTATCRVGDLTKHPGPPASRGCSDSASTAAKKRR
ncbi:hypothetical protein ACOMHN_036650 [Nucella lapillus]